MDGLELKVFESYEVIRKRPAMYLGPIDAEATPRLLWHLVRELAMAEGVRGIELGLRGGGRPGTTAESST